jgi:hypothetical protein
MAHALFFLGGIMQQKPNIILIISDPDEMNNLSAEPAYGDKVKEARSAVLDDWVEPGNADS